MNSRNCTVITSNPILLYFSIFVCYLHMFSSEWKVNPTQEINKTVIPADLLVNVSPTILMPQYPHSKISIAKILQT